MLCVIKLLEVSLILLKVTHGLLVDQSDFDGSLRNLIGQLSCQAHLTLNYSLSEIVAKLSKVEKSKVRIRDPDEDL